VVDVWLSQPTASILNPTDRHAGVLGRLLLGAGSGGNLVSDAHLAALAIEHGAELGTFDRDFARFAGLRLQWLA
jgi:predicted nucleic acid-binding protein